MIKAPRGTHDVLPDEQPLWQRIAGEAEAICAAYGYRRIVTPTIEETDLFQRTSGQGSDVVQKEMYTFTDRGGRFLTLRPEGTAPVARAYVEHGLHREPQPVKTYMIAPMFRYSRAQKGRYREHWQLSVEAIGSADPAVDAELIHLYDALLRRLGATRYRLQVNSIGDGACRPAYLKKLVGWLVEHQDELDAEATAKGSTNALRVFDVKSPRMQALLESAPNIRDALCPPCREHFAAVQDFLDAYGIAYDVVPTLVRGLDYYTRTTFEFVGEALGAQSSLCGGGRYDGLVEEIGGPPTPGVGFGAGIERLVIQLKEEGITESPPGIDVFFALAGEAPRAPILALMAELRREGMRCDTDYVGRSLNGQLTQAARLAARVVVIAAAEGATIRRAEEKDVVVRLDPLLEGLRRELRR